MMSRFALLSLISALCLAGCVDGEGNKNANASALQHANVNAAKTNVEELSLYVRVPYETEEIVWKEFPGQKKLVAALRFSPADAGRIAEECKQAGKVEAVSIPVETWFPEELVAQGETSGDTALRGEACSAASFFQEPYVSGRVIRIEATDYFVLEVTAN